jgi:DNA-binding MarR family transcriptional regulator
MALSPAQSLHQLLLATYRVVAEGRARTGMTNADYAALHHLTYHPEGLTPGQLERRLAITSGSVTKLIDRLEARHLARRTRDPNGDRRSLTVIATKRGIDLTHHELQHLLQRLPDTEAPLTDDARAALARLITLASHPDAAP